MSCRLISYYFAALHIEELYCAVAITYRELVFLGDLRHLERAFSRSRGEQARLLIVVVIPLDEASVVAEYVCIAIASTKNVGELCRERYGLKDRRSGL